MREHTLNEDARSEEHKPDATATSGLWAEGPRELRRAHVALEQQDEELVAQILGARSEEERVAAEVARQQMVGAKRETDSYDPSDAEIASSLF